MESDSYIYLSQNNVMNSDSFPASWTCPNQQQVSVQEHIRCRSGALEFVYGRPCKNMKETPGCLAGTYPIWNVEGLRVNLTIDVAHQSPISQYCWLDAPNGYLTSTSSLACLNDRVWLFEQGPTTLL